VSAELVAEIGERSVGRIGMALFEALRPRQWTKNLLIFAGIVFAAKLGDATRWVEALAAFAAWCAASSASYLVNDVRDREVDRGHPLKRGRPLARGDVGVRTALVAAGLLVTVALVIGLVLGPAPAGLVAAFLAVQGAYTAGLKHVPFLDVLAISGLFVIRAAAGAVAVDVRISPWLLVCTALLALFLALGKRRGELVLVGSSIGAGRRVLRAYSVPLLDRVQFAVAALTVGVYMAYTLSAHDSAALPASVPFVAFGLFRYVYLVRRRGAGEEPDQVLLSDRPILAAVVLWVLTCAVVLATG
jgi:4-hydroxybenzoate polyprenyltransferase